MPKNPQNTISKNAIKHDKTFIVVRTEDIIWLQITADTVMKLKVETRFKERDQNLLELITIDVLNIEKAIFFKSGNHHFTP